ncbi:alpha-2B adrenergic receptor-like [Paramacrobiotus metropolitanus]|uniref:alpha-2B adrenergic receptor-like n=1 Tax=Paramacrobiotus metropolitanus TaxID=2943436 RepID=UPI002445723F|nr:alpha-2B adrenergic receptor-like [Paramacrobiotus metropolitanus]
MASVSSFVWTYYTIGGLVVCLLAVIFNTAVLAILLHKRELLHNPFYIYILNLLATNLVVLIINGPLALLVGGYQVWWFSMDFCDVYLYFSYVLGSVSLLCHLLITTNRIWAVMFPISYKRLHTRKVAALICLSMWIAIHVLMLPGVIINKFNALPLEEYGCIINVISCDKLIAWNAVSEMILTLLNLLIVTAYPFILVKHHRRQRIRPGASQMPAISVPRWSTLWQRFRPAATGDEASHSREDGSLSLGQRATGKQPRLSHRKRQNASAFWVLTLSTGSVFFLLTPCLVYTCFISLGGAYDVNIFNIVTMVYTAQAAVDPLLFVLALTELRSFRKKQP